MPDLLEQAAGQTLGQLDDAGFRRESFLEH